MKDANHFIRMQQNRLEAVQLNQLMDVCSTQKESMIEISCVHGGEQEKAPTLAVDLFIALT